MEFGFLNNNNIYIIGFLCNSAMFYIMNLKILFWELIYGLLSYQKDGWHTKRLRTSHIDV